MFPRFSSFGWASSSHLHAKRKKNRDAQARKSSRIRDVLPFLRPYIYVRGTLAYVDDARQWRTQKDERTRYHPCLITYFGWIAFVFCFFFFPTWRKMRDAQDICSSLGRYMCVHTRKEFTAERARCFQAFVGRRVVSIHYALDGDMNIYRSSSSSKALLRANRTTTKQASYLIRYLTDAMLRFSYTPSSYAIP